jgi:hypothetical protein
MIKMLYNYIVKATTQRQYYVRINGRSPSYRFYICYPHWSNTEHYSIMIKLIVFASLLALVAGCAQQPQHWNRAHGEEYKFYPYTPGTALKVAKEGRACWAEDNREYWDQCQ